MDKEFYMGFDNPKIAKYELVIDTISQKLGLGNCSIKFSYDNKRNPVCRAYHETVNVFNVKGSYDKEFEMYIYSIFGPQITEDLVRKVEEEMITFGIKYKFAF